MNGWWAVLASLLLATTPLESGQEWTPTQYRELIAAYRSAPFVETTSPLVELDLPRSVVAARNDELPAILDAKRPSERRELLAALVMMADAALATNGRNRAFYLDEATALTAVLPRAEREPLVRQIHLAVAGSLLRALRVVEAYDVLEPAALRYPEDVELQFHFGTIAELRGSLENNESVLLRARHAYETVLDTNDAHRKARARLGRVQLLLGELTTAEATLTSALTGLDDTVHRTVALLSLGDVHRRRGEPQKAASVYREALRGEPSCQPAAIALSFVLRQTGDTVGAQTAVFEHFERHRDEAIPDAWLLYRLADSVNARARWDVLRSIYE